MSIKTTLLAFAGGIYAARLYQQARDGQGATAGGSSASGGSSSTSGGSSAASGSSSGFSGNSGGRSSTASMADGGDSLNAGERLREKDLSSSPVAGTPELAEALDEGNLFTSKPEANGTDAPVTGLRDFARGA